MNILSLIKNLFILQILTSCDYSIIATNTANNRFDENCYYSAPPPPLIEDTNNFSFLVISDTHYYNQNLNYGKKLDVLRLKHNAEFLVINGDISESGLEKQFNLFLDDMKDYNGIIYPVLGNHDVLDYGHKTFGKILGKFIYSLEIGNFKLIFLDTSTGTFGDKQKKWYEKELSTDKQIIIFTHYNFVTSTIQELTSISNAEDEYYFIDINARNNVKYVISGHLHKNNEKEIRGVKYQTLTTLKNKKNAVLLISINKAKITTTLLDLPED